MSLEPQLPTFTSLIEEAKDLLLSEEFKNSVKYSRFSWINDAEVRKANQKLIELSKEYLKLIEDLNTFKKLDDKTYLIAVQSFIKRIKKFQDNLIESSENLIKRLNLPQDKKAQFAQIIKKEATGPQELIAFMQKCIGMIKNNPRPSIIVIQHKLEKLGIQQTQPNLTMLDEVTKKYKQTQQEEQSKAVWKKRVSILFSLSATLTYLYPLTILPLSIVFLLSAKTAYEYDSHVKEIQKRLEGIADIENDINEARNNFDITLRVDTYTKIYSDIEELVVQLKENVLELINLLGTEIQEAKSTPPI